MNKEQFAEWKSNPSTIEILKEIEGTKRNLLERLSSGETLGTNADETHGQTARIIGTIEGLSQLLNISYADEPEEGT